MNNVQLSNQELEVILNYLPSAWTDEGGVKEMKNLKRKLREAISE